MIRTLRFGDGNFLTNFFNSENRLSGVRLPSGTVLTNFYDFAGRLTNRQARVSGVVAETASFEYNANDAVTRMTDNTGSTTNLFDPAGRLWGIDYPSGASVRYQLDLLDRISAVTNKASAGGTAYVTRYQRDAVGNVTNVIDPFNGGTSFEYDRVGRRSKRSLPNGIVTEWQYNWKDQVTNIVHKTSGGSILASVLYERAAGGEPTKITREDGSYVLLAYDNALRLTNEVYYSSGGAPQTANGYGFDASGSRVRLVKGGTTLTNSVSAGYRITAVKNGAATVESYIYDNGGRVTGMTRDGATRSFGYNSADQMTAVTNGVAWVTYRHDASGRRTISTNSAGTVRRFMVAPTPETDRELPHLIANAAGTIHQGYVYLGDDPILRYTSSGTAGYYLEDGMGSVIGLAPSSNPSTANTTRLFYDGFGNTRATNGPAPINPTGAGGDFRFHGAWLESDSGLYNMRARDYDPRTGCFTSRDPDGGSYKVPETMNPYAFADDNPFVFSDPTGMFTMIEVNMSSMISQGMQGARAAAVQKARQKILKTIGEVVKDEIVKQVQNVFPIPGLPSNWTKGLESSRAIRDYICDNLHAPDQLFIEVPVNESGTPRGNGITCNREIDPSEVMELVRLGVPRPDFVLGQKPPVSEKNGYNKTWVIGELKSTLAGLHREYVKPGSNPAQFNAIVNYAAKHTYSKVSMFIVATKGKNAPSLAVVEAQFLPKVVEKGSLPIVLLILD